MIFSESPAFSATVNSVLTEDEYFELQDRLIDNPAEGDLIKGSNGLRKIRVASKGKGKRGGARVIYYWFVSPEKIQLCRIYEKSEQSNISKAEIKQITKEIGNE